MRSFEIYDILSEAARTPDEKAGGEVIAAAAEGSCFLHTYAEKWAGAMWALEQFWRRFDPKKGKPSTFIYGSLKQRMNTHGVFLAGPPALGPRTLPDRWKRVSFAEDLRAAFTNGDNGRPRVLREECYDPPDYLGAAEVSEIVDKAIQALPKRTQIIVRMRFWESLTLDETARRLAKTTGTRLTRERIRQIEAKALEALRLPLRLAGVAPPQHANACGSA